MPPNWVPTHILTSEEYHAHPAISRSGLGLIQRSPRHYWERYLNPDHVPGEPTPAMRFGTAVHAAVLEPDLFDRQFALAPALPRTTKAGKEAWAAAAEGGRDLLTEAEHTAILGIRAAVHAHPAAGRCLEIDGINESTFITKDPGTGLDIKCRPDRLTDSGWVVDLKTTQDASAPEFARSIAKFGYHVQAAFYLHTIEVATGTRPKGFIFLAAEKTAPYAVQMLRLGQQSLELGTRTMHQNLATLRQCLESGIWPGYSDTVVDVELPAWALK